MSTEESPAIASVDASALPVRHEQSPAVGSAVAVPAGVGGADPTGDVTGGHAGDLSVQPRGEQPGGEFRAGAPVGSWVPPTWDAVVREHADRVYRLAYRLSGNRADAEDLTQETFVRVFRSLAEYTPGTFEGWLHRITTNLFLDMARRRQRIRFEALPDDVGDRLASPTAGPEQAYSESHLDPEIQRALDALPPDFRAAVVLCDLEQLSYEEIAATLGVKVGTVRSRIHRGRVLLREALAHLAPGVRPSEPGPRDKGAHGDFHPTVAPDPVA
ncbi:MAG: RNA polymerase sigma factor SigE [Actinobacteria bacterium]|nr:RNA polymerase sigma factor SigE [Actinomycetota bacterium]